MKLQASLWSLQNASLETKKVVKVSILTARTSLGLRTHKLQIPHLVLQRQVVDLRRLPETQILSWMKSPAFLAIILAMTMRMKTWTAVFIIVEMMKMTMMTLSEDLEDPGDHPMDFRAHYEH